MKPAAFKYEAPRTVDEALTLLAKHGSDAKVLAGGQSLVPMLNFRLVRPDVLIDLNRISGLGELRAEPNALHIGAMTRTVTLEQNADVARRWPLLREAARLVGHRVIRNRGTVGGSAAHADPQAELPVAFTALDAHFHVRGPRGSRRLPASDFFRDYYGTAIESDELLLEIEVPAPAGGGATSFVEHARAHGDFALAGAAVALAVDRERRCTAAAIAILGGGATPLRARSAERMLLGRTVDDVLAGAVGRTVAEDSDPPDPADYRRALIAEMTRRALLTAAGRATS